MLLGWELLTEAEEELIARGVVHGGVHGGPFALEIQPTNVCNVDCFFCSSKFHRAGEFIDWETVLRPALEEAVSGGLKAVRLSGGGESLVYPKLAQLLEFLQHHNVRISDVTTNATALGRVAEPLVAVGLDGMSLSLNEPTAALWASTMRAPERLFDKALEGIRAVVAAARRRADSRLPVLDLKFMVWRGNYHLVREMVALGAELGVTKVNLNNIIGLSPEKKLLPDQRRELLALLEPLIVEDLKRTTPFLDIWLDEEKEVQQGVYDIYFAHRPNHVVGNGTVEEAWPTRRTEYCLMGWYTMTVAATGKVFPCCNFVGLEGKVMGRLGGESLGAIWRGERYEAFRNEFRRLMLLRGHMEHSPRYDEYIEPYCIAHRECPWGWCLARPEFYGRLAQKLDREAPLPRRLEAQGRDLAMRLAHRVRSLTGTRAGT
jgi:MoaA/NifB/PqqE/SkfB family radical SAM enzyme